MKGAECSKCITIIKMCEIETANWICLASQPASESHSDRPQWDWISGSDAAAAVGYLVVETTEKQVVVSSYKIIS